MIAEIAASHRTSRMFLDIAHRLTGLGESRKKARRSLLAPLFRKMKTG
jgi:pilus assembly protein CpaE